MVAYLQSDVADVQQMLVLTDSHNYQQTKEVCNNEVRLWRRNVFEGKCMWCGM